MAVPKQKRSKSRQLKARSQIFLEKPALVKCSKCRRLILTHTVCPFCGYYRGREVIDVLAKLDKKERKKREKEMKEKEKAAKGEPRQGREEKEIKKTKPLDWRELSKK